MSPSYSSFYEDLLRQTAGSWFDFEGLMRDIYVAVLKPGDWALDVGAHLGAHTFQMAQAVGPDGKVIAIEAVPALVERIVADLHAHYPHLVRTVEFHRCGVSDSEKVVPFYFAPGAAGLSGLRRRDILSAHQVERFDVPLTTIDRICAHSTARISFIKIDIEGAEYEALRGASETIRRHQPLIAFEHSLGTPADFGYGIDEMLAMWDELGYSVYDFFGNSYDIAQPWSDSMIEDYLAFPRSFTRRRQIFEVVQRTLLNEGLRYSIPSCDVSRISTWTTQQDESSPPQRSVTLKHVETASLPFPPLELRGRVGPIVDDSYYDNPDGGYIWGPLDIPPLKAGEAYRRVFDFGCGCGREERRLLLQRDKPEKIVGLDISPEMIEWCQNNLSGPGVTFVHHDVWSVSYAPKNNRNRVLPIRHLGSDFTLIEANSVFTHLHEDQSKFYLDQMRSMLAPTGIIRATWFLFNKKAFPMMGDNLNTIFINEADPSNAVYYDWKAFVTMVHKLGYRIVHINWAQMLGFHNIICLGRSDNFLDISNMTPPGTSVLGY
jgi:FkbM family methyltransferase